MKSFLSPWSITLLCFCAFIRLYLDLRTLRSLLESEAQRLNISSRSNGDFVLYNRVPKSGSQTLWKIIDNLAVSHGFNSTIDSPKLKAIRGSENVYFRDSEQMDYIQMWKHEIPKPYVYNKHFLFVNFEDFGEVNPIYINLVRHPVDRIISWYYYIRNPSYQFVANDEPIEFDALKSGGKAIGSLKRSFEDCVRKGIPECTYVKGQYVLGGHNGGSHHSQISFFCGMHPDCHIFESIKAYDRAVENVEKYFAVVGVSEEFKKSLKILEAYVPRFFDKIDDVYKNGKINVNRFKPLVEQEVWDTLTRNFTLEIKFYEYCKDRLNKQYLTILAKP
eukprot:TRINITY_DN4404_c0_g1_i1.p1 TRINITY_DN4404_c0_g1~~TRINITY_DN4404_c0_g1_i1.p1  ORF type:complete len:333 (+),score=63.69 TRINITY_DN4404_c0_g1_i1:29-1027(+)